MWLFFYVFEDLFPYLYVYGYTTSICVIESHVYLVPAEPEGIDPLEVELQMVVSHHTGAGNQTEILYKTSK